MKNILLSTFFFLVIGFGTANANSGTESSKKESANTEVTSDQAAAEEVSDSETTTIEIKINGKKASGYSWWKATLVIIWTIIIIILVMRTFRGKASV